MNSKWTMAALVAAAAIITWATPGHASNAASDNAADPAYIGGTIDGQNGGTGFSNWVQVAQNGPGGSGSFIGDATQNGNIPSGGGINVGGKSWGLYGNGGNTEVLYRDFTGGSLSLGQSFSIGMDNGYIDSGNVAGFILRNGVDTSNKNNGQRFEFLFIGGNADYYIATNSTSPLIDTGVGYTDGGLLLNFTLTGADTFSLSITGLTSGANTTITGALGGTSGSGIDSVALYNQNAGSGNHYDVYFDQMAITVPEPATAALVAAGLLGAMLIRRRK
jgi:hypothetical protein